MPKAPAFEIFAAVRVLLLGLMAGYLLGKKAKNGTPQSSQVRRAKLVFASW
jgi:hypothetical protein